MELGRETGEEAYGLSCEAGMHSGGTRTTWEEGQVREGLQQCVHGCTNMCI